MKALIFDAGPIITLALNNLLWILPELKAHFGGHFLITPSVHAEIVERPLRTKRFKFEAMQIASLIRAGVLELATNGSISARTAQLLELANSVFSAQQSPLAIVQHGEIESVAAAAELGAEAVVVDERTTRLLLEDPAALAEFLKAKLHAEIELDSAKLAALSKALAKIRLLRSVELVVVAHRLGLLRRYLPELAQPDRELMDGVLWGLKLNGAALSRTELEQIVELEAGR